MSYDSIYHFMRFTTTKYILSCYEGVGVRGFVYRLHSPGSKCFLSSPSSRVDGPAVRCERAAMTVMSERCCVGLHSAERSHIMAGNCLGD
jgi:hypothetical protein